MDIYNRLREKPSDPMNYVFIGRYRHGLALEKRFGMLTFILTETAAKREFTRKQLNLIFHRFVRCVMKRTEEDSYEEEYVSHPEETAMCLSMPSPKSPILSTCLCFPAIF